LEARDIKDIETNINLKYFFECLELECSTYVINNGHPKEEKRTQLLVDKFIIEI